MKDITSTLYVIRKDGQGSGGFLCPPGHPNLEYVVYGYYKGHRKQEPDSVSSIEYLIENKYSDVPGSMQAQANKIMDGAQLVYSERWVRYVYGYFRHMYTPGDGSRNASDAISTSQLHCVCGALTYNSKGLSYHLEKEGDGHHQVFPLPPAERHLGYLTVHDYFPEHTPRLDLIEDPGKGYGAYLCAKCGQRVQYEARKDALCVVKSGSRRTYDPVCPKGGAHLLEGETE